MTPHLRRLRMIPLLAAIGCAGPHAPRPSEPRAVTSTANPAWAASAARMIRAAEGRLAPVYAPLAAHVVDRFDLADKEGIGIDIGGGPGTLIVELGQRTRLHWINADINPCFFPSFLQRAERAGLAGRVSAIVADVHALPFRDGYADVIVSRGSIPFWDDWEQALREIDRVLAPGGVAFVGRGFSPNLPLETARAIRARGGPPPYDPEEMAARIGRILDAQGVASYRVERPHAETSDVNYGVWVEIRKPPRGK